MTTINIPSIFNGRPSLIPLISALLFTLYFNASVIYALPSIVRIFTGLVFVAWMIIVLLTDNKTITLNTAISAWAFVIIFCYALAAYNTKEIFWSIERAFNLAQIIIVIFAVHILARQIYFHTAALIITLSVIAVSGYVVITSGFNINDEYKELDLDINAARSNLSVWLALGIPYVIYAIRSHKAILIISITTIVIAQIAIGGRNGILVSFLIISFSMFRQWKSMLPFLIIALPVSLFIIYELFYYQLRLDRLDGINIRDIDIAALDYISAGRIGQYIWSIDQIISSPFFGKGFDASFYNNFPVHNMYLRVLVEGGIFMLAMVMYIPIKSLANYNSKFKLEFFTIRLVIVGSLLAAMFEPYLIFGTLSYSLVFWVSIVYSIALKPSTQLKPNI